MLMTIIIRTYPTYNSYLIPENCVVCTYLCWQKAKGSNMRSEINVYCAKRKTASKHVFVFMLVIICIVWNVFSRYTASISSEQIMLAANNYLLEELSFTDYRIKWCWVISYNFTECGKDSHCPQLSQRLSPVRREPYPFCDTNANVCRSNV